MVILKNVSAEINNRPFKRRGQPWPPASEFFKASYSQYWLPQVAAVDRRNDLAHPLGQQKRPHDVFESRYNVRPGTP